MRLAKQQSGLIFEDDFLNLDDARWVLTNSNYASVTERPGYLRLNHASDFDVFALFDIQASNLICEAHADYTPTAVGDEAGMVIWHNSADYIEFVETIDSVAAQTYLNWRIRKTGNTYDFFAEKSGSWEFIDSLMVEGVSKAGFITKAVSETGSVPLDVERIVVCTSNTITVSNLKAGYLVELYDLSDQLVSSFIVPNSDNKVILTLPFLRFDGYIRVLDSVNNEVDRTSGHFYGGDIYSYRSYLDILDNTISIPVNTPYDFGEMQNGEIFHKYTLKNSSLLTATNIVLSVVRHEQEFGIEWAYIAKDVSGVPDTYGTSISFDSLGPGESLDFWVRVRRDPNTPYEGDDNLLFELDLDHL